jgi:chromosome segregation ATPase
MPNPSEPREVEAMAVTLTRMEGKLDGVAEKVSDLRTEVTMHRGQIGSLQSEMQQVKSDADGAAKALQDADRGREALAKALKDADEKRVADAKAIVDQSAQKWAASPAMRLYATLGGIAALTATIYYLSHPHG